MNGRRLLSHAGEFKKTKSLPLKMVPTTVPNDRFLEKIFRKKLIRIVAWLDLDLCVFLDYLSWIIFFCLEKKNHFQSLFSSSLVDSLSPFIIVSDDKKLFSFICYSLSLTIYQLSSVSGEQEKKSFSFLLLVSIELKASLTFSLATKNELFDANKDLICTRGNQVI